MRQLLLGLLIGAATMTLILSGMARARPPVPGPVFKAVRAHWQTRSERIQAFDVCYCESRYYTGARNGEYLGLFQCGLFCRLHYGFGWDAMSQARSAYRYFVDSGRDWSPWSCKPRWRAA